MKTLPQNVINTLGRCFKACPGTLEFLGGGQDWSDGTLYSFIPDSGNRQNSNPVKMVIKFLDYPAADTAALQRFRQRVEFARYFGDKGNRIIRPELSADGNLYETLQVDNTVYVAYTYKMARGRVLNAQDPAVRTGAYYKAMGAAIGQLHADWEQRSEVLSPDGTSDQSQVLKGWRDEWAFFRSWCRDDEVGRAWEHLQTGLGQLPVNKSTYGFVHNDAHAWNLIFDPDAEPACSGGEPEFTIIDFDVANYHFFMIDAAVALYSIEMTGAGGIETEQGAPAGFMDRASGLFWEGYNRFRTPGNWWKEQPDLFLQYRRCLIFITFQEQTALHPVWQARWKAAILREDARLFG